MDELIIKETMSSLQIAEISGKHHKDVMRAIRKMEPAWEKICGRKFALTSQIVDMPNGGTRKESCYILNKTECLFIATKFNDEARAKLVLRWEELERKNTKNEISLPDFSNPAEAARAWAAEYEQKQQLALENKRQAQQLEVKDAQITELNTAVSVMQPKVSYVDTILQCKDTVQTTIIAQDYGKSAKAFNVLLRNFGIQRKVGTTWVLYAKHISNGYVQSKTFTYRHKDGTEGARTYSEWTQRGRLFLYDTLKEHGILPLIEKLSTLTNETK